MVLSAAYGSLLEPFGAAENPTQQMYLSHILAIMLEKRPQAIGQWNIESTLATVCERVGLGKGPSMPDDVSYTRSSHLVQLIIKKHRLRIEGHYHLLLTTLLGLLRALIVSETGGIRSQARSGNTLHLVARTADSNSSTEEANRALEAKAQENKAQQLARLITLVCEPTAGAVSRSQKSNSLESATDAAKRSAGKHMYFLLMEYVKLQLETTISRATRDILEPAMNSIFDITPVDIRKILNDSMDTNGRAILREMFKRYTQFGKWTGV